MLTLDKQNAINFQLLGGIWILQTFPVIVFSLYTRWFHRWALLAGWAVGMVYGTIEAYQVINPVTGKHFGGSLGEIPGLGEMGYIAMTAFVAQPRGRVVLTLVLNAAKVVQRQTRRHRATTSPTRVTRGWRRTGPCVEEVEETDPASASSGDDHRVGGPARGARSGGARGR